MLPQDIQCLQPTGRHSHCSDECGTAAVSRPPLHHQLFLIYQLSSNRATTGSSQAPRWTASSVIASLGKLHAQLKHISCQFQGLSGASGAHTLVLALSQQVAHHDPAQLLVVDQQDVNLLGFLPQSQRSLPYPQPGCPPSNGTTG